ncbi:MAG: ferritin family protein [Candidatus Omnitrophica bacterium]|nr:ferritin family protein [Candidatus Omnitrophota bacterium]
MKYERKDKYTKPQTPADILDLALQKEESSYKFYEDMLKITTSPILKKLLSELKDAELGHIEKIKHKMTH